MEVDTKAIEFVIAAGLPVRSRWMIEGTPLDFDFSLAREGLRRLPPDAFEAGDVVGAGLLVFGEQDYADGGGARPWLCVGNRDGAVWGFDPERDQPTYLLNTSIERFVATFRFLDEHLGKCGHLPSGYEGFVRNLDPDAYPRSEWRLLVEYLGSE